MSTIDEYEIEKELINFLRNEDIISIANRDVVTTTQNETAVGGETYIDLTNTNVKNVRLFTINSSTQSYGTDYSIDFDGDNPGRISITSALSLNDVTAIQYDYGATDSIYPDFPRVDLNYGSYPRVSCIITSASSRDIAVGGQAQLSDIMVSITVFGENKKNIYSMSKDIRDSIQNASKSFYNFEYIHPLNSGRLMHEPNRNDKIDQKTDDYKIPNVLEVN